MDTLTGFGLFAVTAMLVTYALEGVHSRICRGVQPASQSPARSPGMIFETGSLGLGS
jgi:hypothetical protein